MPSARLEGSVRLVLQRHLDVDAFVMIHDRHFLDIVRRGGDALGDGEADREILQIGGARHHHGVGRAVEGKCDRNFFRHQPSR